MTKRALLRALGWIAEPFRQFGAGGGLMVFAAAVLLLAVMWSAGCAATRATQTQALPEAPAGLAAASQPSRAELDQLAAQQNGLINAVSSIAQRVEATATATVNANTNFGLAAFGTISVVCLTLGLIVYLLYRLLWQDEEGDQARCRAIESEGL